MHRYRIKNCNRCQCGGKLRFNFRDADTTLDTGRPPFSSPITQYRLRCECGARTECEMITIEISLR